MERISRNKDGLQTEILHAGEHSENAEQIEAIEKTAFPDPWSVRSIQETLEQKHYLNLGIRKEGKLLGYLFFSYVLDEGEIVRIAVDPAVQRQGAATVLFQELLKFCEEKQIVKIMLDVRAQNVPAIAFYRAMGFEEDGLRKNFYTNPTEDAILMSREVITIRS